MTLQDRAEAYRLAFPTWKAGWPWVGQEQGHDVLYAVWQVGQDYRNRTRYYGAYPNSYLDRVLALFPDVVVRPDMVLHAFSGSLPPGPYARCDLRQDADIRCAVADLPTQTACRFQLILADPPYTPHDAQKYGTPPLHRAAAVHALARVARPGAFLVWLDLRWPMHRKAEWLTVGRISLWRSTGHYVRAVTLFQRQPWETEMGS